MDQPNGRLRVFLLDDDPVMLRVLYTYLQTDGRLIVIGTETDSVRALQYMRNNPVDLLISDIVMEGFDGISLVKSMQPRPAVILVTAYTERAMDAFDIQVDDCIPKPVDYARLAEAINRVISKATYSEAFGRGFLFVKDVKEGFDAKIVFADVGLVKSDKNYVCFHLSDKRKVKTRTTLRELMSILPRNIFIQAHRSYAVNIHKVIKFSRAMRQFYLLDYDIPLSIGAEYLDDFVKAYYPSEKMGN
ncbi:LytR/AlgR family response regulator transcription factor [Sphingobacterium sp. SGR-19]|uniref:LytR/AlgR family response regulator transcription factor n=1 Tax=Sphingobacterium sp. SGR-19 TaxID=2710886 RepID=UPI0013EA5DFE|nr:LytTR family DNA-binding domain-containing protein [Sphingobacterium sp. SGR-19]NGM65303.1 response regulator transcription factor [Sphingobacterium sp. SGR-19]